MTEKIRFPYQEATAAASKRLQNQRNAAKRAGLTLVEYQAELERKAAAARARREALSNLKPAAQLRAELEAELSTVPDWWRKMAINRLIQLATPYS
ncbi:hypothetical protein P3911_004478 [Salmonella enterica]|nr:hypothetical protein [Salmonella enterica]